MTYDIGTGARTMGKALVLFQRILTTVYKIQDYWNVEIFPSSGIPKNTKARRFGN
jgi:hypothetical protein